MKIVIQVDDNSSAPIEVVKMEPSPGDLTGLERAAKRLLETAAFPGRSSLNYSNAVREVYEASSRLMGRSEG